MAKLDIQYSQSCHKRGTEMFKQLAGITTDVRLYLYQNLSIFYIIVIYILLVESISSFDIFHGLCAYKSKTNLNGYRRNAFTSYCFQIVYQLMVGPYAFYTCN